MQLAWQCRLRMRTRKAIMYMLAAALLMLAIGIPAKVKGAGAAFTDFQVTTETPSLYSGYYVSSGNYTKETPVYHFHVTTQDALAAGDTIQIQLPYSYNFVGNPHWYGLWTAGAAVPVNQIASTIDGTPSSLFDSATTQFGETGDPALSFHMAQSVTAGAVVDIKLTGFLITPDYHYKTPGPETYSVSTGSNPTVLTTNSNIYFRSVMNFRPDSATYAASAHTAYQFGFTVMQTLTPADTVTIKFPTQMSLPAAVDPSKVLINGTPAASATVVGDKLQLQPSQTLSSYTPALITIDPTALISNPSVPGYYSFELSTSTDPSAATERIGIVSAAGASLADNPSLNEGYISVESNGTLRFRFTSPTILKGGDTVTVKSPAGTLLSGATLTGHDIVIEPGMVESPDNFTPASFTRVSDNELQFVLPADYYLSPDYGLTFSIPNPFGQQYGLYDIQVTTSQTVKPDTVPLLITPDTVQQFSVASGSRIAGATGVPYTFTLKPNEPLSADNNDYIVLQLPSQLSLPVVIDPMSWSGTIDPSLVLVNGVPAKDVTYIKFTNSLKVTVPQDIPLLGKVEITVSGNAGWTNPVEGTYSFIVYPNWSSGSQAEATCSYASLAGITAAPQAVRLQLGSTVSRQLTVTGQLSDATTQDVTAAAQGTTYRIDDATVATVSGEGLIEAKQAGQAVITVTNGAFSDTIHVVVDEAEVVQPEVQMTSIAAAPHAVQLQLGAVVSRQLKVTAQLSDHSTQDVTDAVYGTAYRSQDTAVATVTPNGLIEGKRAGTAVITVTNSVYSDTVHVTVAPAAEQQPEVTSITAAPHTVQLQLGAAVSQQLTVTAQLMDRSAQEVTAAVYGTSYRSSDTTVVTVSPNGLVEAKQAGAAVITVTNSVYSDTVNVTVLPASSNGNKHRGSSSAAASSSTSAETSSGGVASTDKPISIEKELLALLGGTVELPEAAAVTVPAQALPKDGKVKVEIRMDPPPAPAGRTSVSAAAAFSSSTGPDLHGPIQVSLTYNQAAVGTGMKPALYRFNQVQGKWLYIGGTTDGHGMITAEVKTWGTYAVFAVEPHPFSDMSGHWSAEYVDRLIGRAVVDGFEDETFRPDQPVTRAQLVKMIADALTLKAAEAPSLFADQDALPAWSKEAIAQAVQAGVIEGYEEQGAVWFKPNQPLTRAELVVIIARVLERHSMSGGNVASAFTDDKDIPGWAQSAVQAVYGEHIVSGYPDGAFRPGGQVTRAEAAKMIYMLLESLHS